MSGALNRLRFMVQFVTGVVIDDHGNAKCEGADGEDLAPTVGYHFGFYSRPTRSRGVALKADGQGNTSFLVAFRNKQYELTLSKGEVGMKNEFDAYFLLNKNGVAEVNGTDYSLAKTEVLLTALKGLAQAIGTIFAAATDTGIVTAAALAPVPAILDPSTNTPYATNSAAIIGLLAVATPYKSTKAKNG